MNQMTEQKQAEEAIWRFMQKRLGYSDAELEIFKSTPRNLKILERANDLVNKTVIFEVIESHGCNIEHKVGDRFFFSAEGYMLAHKCPKKICPYILPAMSRLMWIIQERIYEQLDPLPFFHRAHCQDVGIECGGWGKILIEARIENR